MTVLTTRLRTLRDYIRWAVSRFQAEQLFFGHGTDNAWDEARQLVLGALHLPWEISDAYLDCRLEDDEHAHLQALLKRRIEERVPTAYLLGEAWFCGLPFVVDERVLVPRVLGDLSFDALEVANLNIERHGLEERVYCVQGDGFAGLPGQRFDLIVSNPPYVDAEDFADMPAEYQHEPAMGLACGNDGLDLVRRMLAEAADHLTERGVLIVEVGNSQVHVEALYPEVEFTWMDFQHGGHGVFLLAAKQCREHQELFRSRVQG
ncbi:MAG: 50S ribosomal protein L3 N(5)-glutamine methyltransferase [Gammaproteobacteria bacterium HGW-Gammaproteobacteria-12]|nr:MAG: 50S ribosomal protein L3 N(5)-glutamine methyltransferase [Gammaproteobacteria bacterium HGW-Gammaproteobacteria-12]